MLVRITEDELWPVYYLSPSGSAKWQKDSSFDVPDELIKKYRDASAEFMRLAGEIASILYDRDIEPEDDYSSMVDKEIKC